MSKNWMYNSLVNGLDDNVGLLAYSLYKFEKNELAEKLLTENKSEMLIKKELKKFHDQANVAGRILSYRERAKTLVWDLMEQLEIDIRIEYQVQFENINTLLSDLDKMDEIIKNHPAIIKKEREDAILVFHRAISTRELKKYSIILRFLLWFRDGFQGVFATLFLAIIIYGICVVILPSEDRQGVIDKAYDNIKSSLFQQPNFPLP